MDSIYDNSALIALENGDILRDSPSYVYKKTPGDKFHDCKQGQTLRIISMGYYNTPNKWAIIAIANKIINPFEELSGRQLVIPA